MAEGGCHCGAIRYKVDGEIHHSALCHCEDCQRSSGAPMVGWAAFNSDNVEITKGKPKVYHSSENGRRNFCSDCGTGLFYLNAENLPGITDIKTATLDDPNAFAPAVHIQTADQLEWMKNAHNLPQFERFPGM